MQVSHEDNSKLRERRMTNSVPVLIEDDETKPLSASGRPNNLLKRKAKQTLRSIDIISIRIGVFLRRYPIARMFIILYILRRWVKKKFLTIFSEKIINFSHVRSSSYVGFIDTVCR